MREVSERADEPMPKTGGFVSEKEYSTHVLGVCGSENMLYSNEPSRVANFNASGHVYLNNHHVMSIQNSKCHTLSPNLRFTSGVFLEQPSPVSVVYRMVRPSQLAVADHTENCHPSDGRLDDRDAPDAMKGGAGIGENFRLGIRVKTVLETAFPSS